MKEWFQNKRNHCSAKNILQIRKRVVTLHSKSKPNDYETDTKQQSNSKAEKGWGRYSQKNQQALGACWNIWPLSQGCCRRALQCNNKQYWDWGTWRHPSQLEHQKSSEAFKSAGQNSPSHRREASGASKSQEAWSFGRSHNGAHHPYMHKQVHGGHQKEKTCCMILREWEWLVPKIEEPILLKESLQGRYEHSSFTPQFRECWFCLYVFYYYNNRGGGLFR